MAAPGAYWMTWLSVLKIAMAAMLILGYRPYQAQVGPAKWKIKMEPHQELKKELKTAFST